jgi:hypothetical protein
MLFPPGALIGLLVGSAAASPIYPSTLSSELGLCKPPPCTVCHQDLLGGLDTVVHPFGMELQDRGLTGGSATDLLLTALAALETDGVDSDGDGTNDVDELRGGMDPNPDGVAFCDVVSPTYGCVGTQNSVVPSGRVGGGAGILAAVGIAAAMLRRRR